MPWELSRRRFNQIGASIGMTALAGCEDSGVGSSVESTEDGGQGDSNSSTQDSTTDAAGQSTAGPFSYIIEKHDGVVRSVEGRTGDVVFDGVAGEDDAAVIQGTFDEINGDTIEGVGGSVFIKQAVYEIREGEGYSALGVSANNAQIISDFARLRFHPHNVVTEDGIEEQIDFKISGSNTRVSGLILDGNKENRELPTRTFGISNCEHVWVDSCVIRNGKMVDGKRGYGIGGPSNASHVTVSNCVLENNDSHGIHPGGPEQMDDHKFINCTFLNNGLGIGARNGTTRTIIANNYFSENGRGVTMTGGPVSHQSILITGNLFSNNHREGKGSEQLVVNDSFDHLRIANNIFTLPSRPDESDQEQARFHVQLAPEPGAGTVQLSNNHIEGGNGPGLVIMDVQNQESLSLERAIISDNYVANVSPRNRPLVLQNVSHALVQNNYFQQPSSRPPAELRFQPPLENLALTTNVVENVQMEGTDELENVVETGTIRW